MTITGIHIEAAFLKSNLIHILLEGLALCFDKVFSSWAAFLCTAKVCLELANVAPIM